MHFRLSTPGQFSMQTGGHYSTRANTKVINMTGKQAKFAVRGAQNEAMASALIGHLCAPSQVPREHDFGIDFFCQLYSFGAASVTSEDLFSLQVKGSSEAVRYGGTDDDGKWRDYEIRWLQSQALPIFIARVRQHDQIDIYSLGLVWRVLWQAQNPFEIKCTTEEATSTPYTITEASFEPATNANGQGDGSTWAVPLGPPFLRLTHTEVRDQNFVHSARDHLARYVELERVNLIRFMLRTAIHRYPETWATNSFGPITKVHKAMYWSQLPGENIVELMRAVEPALVNLGVHLQWQNDRSAYRLIDVLEWLNGNSHLGAFGRGLLEGLKKTRDAGVDPHEPNHTG